MNAAAVPEGELRLIAQESGVAPKLVTGSKICTYSIGGDIPFFMEPANIIQLKNLIKGLKDAGFAYKVIGAGSNLLINSAGLTLPVIKLGAGFKFNEKLTDVTFRVGAGSSLMNLSRSFSLAGLSGLEFAGGIPASLGGAVRMNAGAHQGQMADVISSVEIINPDGEQEVIDARKIEFTYRHCSLPADSIVTAVIVKLSQSEAVYTEALRVKNLAHRKATQPLTHPSAGSVFKNPAVDNPAGKIIESLGFKGTAVGGALVSELHANWIVNPERRASSQDVLALISMIQDRARADLNIQLKPELIYWE